MPFTLAHPAILIPLEKAARRYQGVLSALIIGSLLPDFSYFLPLGVTRYESHTWFAILWFCLPVGVVFYLVYHALLVPVLYSLVPNKLRQKVSNRFATAQVPKLKQLPFIMLGVIIGASSHLFWDSFTHAYSYNWPVQNIGFLSKTAFHIGDDYPLQVYRLLQHLSSALGLVAVCWWIRRNFLTAPEQTTPAWSPSVKIRYIAAFLLIIPPMIYGVSNAFLLINNGPLTYQIIKFATLTVIFGGRMFLLMWLSLGIYYWWLTKKDSMTDTPITNKP